MAQGRRTQRNNRAQLHEALMAASQFLYAALQRLRTYRQTLPNITTTPSSFVFIYVTAALHDLAMYTGRSVKLLVSKPARLAYTAIILAITLTGTVVAIRLSTQTIRMYADVIDNPTALMNHKNTGITILDTHNVTLYQGYGAVDRENIPFGEMPAALRQATIATEDPDFYSNPGFSVRGTARAAYQDIVHTGKNQGGSTITQQLVKNTLLSNEKSFSRKFKEVVLAMELERHYSKDQILQMYLNTVYYGQGAYGVESASETYFHKPAKTLTVAESALLAGLPQSPSTYAPTVNPEIAQARRDYVLERMQEAHYISRQTAQSTKLQPVQAGTRQIVIRAPHFVFYVLDQLREQYGETAIEHDGMVVHTTLDYAKQQKAEEIVRTQVNKLAGHHASNGGLVSVNPHTGGIVSMVGSVDYDQPGYGAVNVTTSLLQPGSSFKPIAYATAFEKGWNGATVVQDKPLSLPDGTGGTYKPMNYDLKFRGPVTLRRALANSLNIPAIEVMQYATIGNTLTMAHNLGMSPASLTHTQNYGLSLVLGAGDVTPIDMATVYSTFANQGTAVAPRTIDKVTNKFGQDVTKETFKPHAGHKALDPRIAYMVTNILSDNQARTEEFGQNSPLKLNRPAAAKTGTTNDFRDNWTVGYTPDLVTAVWVGNNDHTPMLNVDGITGAAPIWHDYMEMALTGTPAHDFTVPQGVVMAKVCTTDGGLVDPNDPNGVTEVFLAEKPQTKHCGQVDTGGQVVLPRLIPHTEPVNPLPQQASAPTTQIPNTQPGRGEGPPEDQQPPSPPTTTPPPPSTAPAPPGKTPAPSG